MFGEFLSWDLEEAVRHLPLKPGQAVTLSVSIRVKLDFSGQENLLQDLNDGENSEPAAQPPDEYTMNTVIHDKAPSVLGVGPL